MGFTFFFLSSFFLLSGVTIAVCQRVSCLSVFCRVVYRHMRLVRSRFGASTAYLAIHLPGRVLLFGFSLPFTVFVSDSLPTVPCLPSLACVCLLCSFPSVPHFCLRVSFPFLFVFVGLASYVSSFGFGIIVSFCVALLRASISFLFVPACWPFLVLFLVFRCRCLFFLSVASSWASLELVHSFPILFDLLVIGSLVFLQLYLSLCRCLQRLPKLVPASSLVSFAGFLDPARVPRLPSPFPA